MENMFLPEITSFNDLITTVEAVGLLPMFDVGIPGFSVEACTAPALWFQEGADGPWQWKGPAVRTGRVLYGKFFGGKAGFVSRALFPDFANVRRDGYDAEGFWQDGLMRQTDKLVLDEITRSGRIRSDILKHRCDFRKGGRKGFDTVITRLQQLTFVCIADFPYKVDKTGRTYGWGISEYATPEALIGEDELNACASTADASRRLLTQWVQSHLPPLTDRQLKLMIG